MSYTILNTMCGPLELQATVESLLHLVCWQPRSWRMAASIGCFSHRCSGLGQSIFNNKSAAGYHCDCVVSKAGPLISAGDDLPAMICPPPMHLFARMAAIGSTKRIRASVAPPTPPSSSTNNAKLLASLRALALSQQFHFFAAPCLIMQNNIPHLSCKRRIVPLIT